MPAEMNLAEIVEEGKRLEGLIQDAIDARQPETADYCIDKRNNFYAEHGPRLVKIAEAAVEAERLTTIFQREYSTAPPDADSTAWTQRAWAASGVADDAIEKLFAVVRGDALASPAPVAGEEGKP